jgi:hypothetical protein
MESLLQIALLLEAFVVFFAGLVAFGLRTAPLWALLLGALGIVALLAIAAVGARFTWGVAVGFVAQSALIATGVLVSLMYVIGIGLLGLYIFCFVKGRQLDRSKAAYLAAQPKENNA